MSHKSYNSPMSRAALSRRAALAGLFTAVAPLVVRTPGLLMPVKKLPVYDTELGWYVHKLPLAYTVDITVAGELVGQFDLLNDGDEWRAYYGCAPLDVKIDCGSAPLYIEIEA